MRSLLLGAAVATFASQVYAKPIVTSSEETFSRVCLERSVAPDRIVAACEVALAEAGLTTSQRVEFAIALGDGHLWSERYDRAVESYQQAIKLDETATEAWNGLGWALWESDGPQAAFEVFETSLAIDVSVQGLGGKAAAGRRTGDISNSEARDMLNAALAIDPDYIWALREVAWSHIEEENLTAADEMFSAALNIDPDDVNARYGLGRVALAEGKAEEALETFNDVLADMPDDFPSLVYRIIALRELDRNAQALREADRLIAAYPEMTSGYVERGQALLALGRRGEAIETYRTADERLGPDNAILYWFADALTADGRFDEALAVINHGLTLENADYSDFLLQSYIALELENYELARQAAEASLATGVRDPWAHYYIAITLVHAGDVTAGVERFDLAIAEGLPVDRVGAFAMELIGAGKVVAATELRTKY